MSSGHCIPASASTRPRARSNRTTRFMARVSSSSEHDANCCPPIACLAPAMLSTALRARARRTATPSSSTEAGRITRWTRVRLRREWTSLTSGPEGPADCRSRPEPRRRMAGGSGVSTCQSSSRPARRPGAARSLRALSMSRDCNRAPGPFKAFRSSGACRGGEQPAGHEPRRRRRPWRRRRLRGRRGRSRGAS